MGLMNRGNFEIQEQRKMTKNSPGQAVVVVKLSSRATVEEKFKTSIVDTHITTLQCSRTVVDFYLFIYL